MSRRDSIATEPKVIIEETNIDVATKLESEEPSFRICEEDSSIGSTPPIRSDLISSSSESRSVSQSPSNLLGDVCTVNEVEKTIDSIFGEKSGLLDVKVRKDQENELRARLKSAPESYDWEGTTIDREINDIVQGIYENFICKKIFTFDGDFI